MKRAMLVAFLFLVVGCGGGVIDQGMPKKSVSLGGTTKISGDAAQTEIAIAGYRSNYTIARADNGVVMVTNNLTGGITSYDGLKLIKFFDSYTSFDVSGGAGQVYRLYQAAFNRKPDQSGLGFWIKAAQNGSSLDAIAAGFIASNEFQTLYGKDVASTQFITLLYNNILHRAPEQGGYDWWVDAVNKGASRSGVLLGFSDSSENKNNLAADMANGLDYIPYMVGGKAIPKFTSYENAKATGILPTTIPLINESKIGITNGYALADFFQDGTLGMVAFSENGNADNARGNHTIPGKVYFYKKDSAGKWLDVSTQLITDRTGCISPRKVIIADFNADGLPDVFASCSGIDDESGVGEQPRVLLSQKDGRYINVGLGFNCYCHGAAAIDTEHNGFADVAIVDPRFSNQPVYLKNNRNGTFTRDLDRFNDEVKPWGANFSRPIYTVEFLDINGDGFADLVLAGSERPCCVNQPLSGMPTTVYKNDGRNSFKEKLLTLPVNDDFPLVLDMVYLSGKLYTLRVGYLYESVAIGRFDLGSQTQDIVYSRSATFENGSHWFDWIVPVDGMIQPFNLAYKVSVK